MADLRKKPPPFKAGQPVSAAALNALRTAIPRLITGGRGIRVTKLVDRVVISLAPVSGAAAGDSALVEVVAIHGTYLICDRDGATIAVAKPWGMRRGVVFPTGYSYTYDEVDFNRRIVTGVADEIEQRITPDYAIGEEILARRLPSSRIFTDAEEGEEGTMIVWVDENNLGRCWAELE